MVHDVVDDAVGIDAAQEHLEWMRAEFRAAQQRRYEKNAVAVFNKALLARPPEHDAEPPRASPLRRIPFTGAHT